MSRTAVFIAAAGILALAPGAWSQEPAASSAGSGQHASLPEDIHAIRQIIEQQSKQLDALAREIAQLNLLLGGDHKPTTPEPPAGHAEPAPAPEPSGPTGEPGSASAAPPHEGMEIQKAEPVATAGGQKHTVAKGETLTSIAKQYNIPIADLQKANQIHDERKLQIGQILNIPAVKAPPTPTDKKDKHNG